MLNPRVLARLGGPRPTKFSVDWDTKEINAQNLRLKLQVETKVTNANARTLKTKGKELVSIIEATGLELEFSVSVKIGDYTHLYNYWDMHGDANTLVYADYILPDEPPYAEFGKFIIAETKNIVIPLTPPDLLSRPELQAGQLFESDRYVRIVYRLTESQLAEFAAQREAGLVDFAKSSGWKPIDVYLSVTGTSGHEDIPIVEVWRIPGNLDGTAADAIKSKMNQAPWLKDAKIETDSTRILDTPLLPLS